MDMNSIMVKIDTINEELGEEALLLDQDNTMFTLNQTAKFIWENCDGKKVIDLAKLLYNQCINKEDLDFSDIQEDCLESVKAMIQNGFIKIEE